MKITVLKLLGDIIGVIKFLKIMAEYIPAIKMANYSIFMIIKKNCALPDGMKNLNLEKFFTMKINYFFLVGLDI